jgi:hypothetical protein
LVTINIVLYCEVDAQLQSFPRQEITVGSRDGIQLNGTANTQTKADYKDRLDKSSDIEKVTYFSDGKSLNATLWLGDNVTKNPSMKGANIVAYGALIDWITIQQLGNLELITKRRSNGPTKPTSGIAF